MLPAAHRLRESGAFRAASRRGSRSAARTLVVHLQRDAGAPEDGDGGLRVGFVVSKAVGNAVVRNRVRRRLRHLVRDRLGGLPHDGVLVVRSLPAAATASSAQLAGDLDRCLQRVTA